MPNNEDPALDNLISEMRYITETSAIKLAEDVGAPIEGIEMADYLANDVDSLTAQLKQANDLRDGLITEEIIKSAEYDNPEHSDKDKEKDEKEDKEASEITSEKEAMGYGEAAEKAKDKGKPKDKDAPKNAEVDIDDDGDKDAPAEFLDHVKNSSEKKSSFDILGEPPSYWIDEGPKEVVAACSDGFMDVLNENRDEFNIAFDTIVGGVVGAI